MKPDLALPVPDSEQGRLYYLAGAVFERLAIRHQWQFLQAAAMTHNMDAQYEAEDPGFLADALKESAFQAKFGKLIDAWLKEAE